MAKGKVEVSDFTLEPTEIVSPVEAAEALLAGLTSKETAEALSKMSGGRLKAHEVAPGVRLLVVGSLAQLVGNVVQKAFRAAPATTSVELMDHLRTKGEVRYPDRAVLLRSSRGEVRGTGAGAKCDMLIEFGYMLETGEQVLEAIDGDIDGLISQVQAWRDKTLLVNEKRKQILP